MAAVLAATTRRLVGGAGPGIIGPVSAGRRLPSTPEPMRYWHGRNGLRLAGDEWGEPGGRVVILQHGGGQTRHAWKGAGQALATSGYHAVAFDARGHGDSDWAGAG